MWSGRLSAEFNGFRRAQVRAWTPKLTPPFVLAAKNKNPFFFHNLFVCLVFFFFMKTNRTVQVRDLRSLNVSGNNVGTRFS